MKNVTLMELRKNKDSFISAKKAAEVLGISRQTYSRMLENAYGTDDYIGYSFFKLGNRWKVNRAEFLRWIDDR